MIVKDILYEDFVNYKNPCTTIEMPICSFKCDKENGKPVCQNSALAAAQNIDIDIQYIIERYINNEITEALCFQGLEPFDSWDDLYIFCQKFRQKCADDIVIYTGYNKDEIIDKVNKLQEFRNVIIKFGRYIPDKKSHYDEILGVELASENQYAERIS